MIIDAHVHLPVCNGGHSLQRQKERLLYEMKENRVSHCIVISDSTIRNDEKCSGTGMVLEAFRTVWNRDKNARFQYKYV